MKLSNAKFRDLSYVQELDKNEQKLILGGYIDDTQSCCIYVDSSNVYHCTNSPNHAYNSTTDHGGFWACNTEEAHNRCASITSFC